MLTFIEGYSVKDMTSEEKPLDLESQEAITSGLENLLFMNDLELEDGQANISLEPSPVPSDKSEESPETSLAKLKDEFHGCRYSVVLLPKRHADGTQRLVIEPILLKNVGCSRQTLNSVTCNRPF